MPLPLHILEREFPGTGKGLNPVIETDGDSLYIRNVRINGKMYDLRIWRLTDKNRPMLVTGETPFSKQTIIETVHLAMEIFGSIHFRDNPTGTRMWYSDVKDRPFCLLQNVLVPEGRPDEEKYINLSANHPEHPLIGQMAQLHHLFFHDAGTVVTTDPTAIILPKRIRAEKYPPEAKEGAAKKKRKKSAPLPEHVKEQLPASIKSASTNTDGPAVTNATGSETPKRIRAEDHVDNLRAALGEASKTFETEASLFKGISYLDLEKYAQDRDKEQNAKLEEIYQTYLRVLKAPTATGDPEAEEMKKWLKHHYKAAVEKYKELDFVWKVKKEGREEFADWYQYYAAKAIAGFILARGHSIDGLVAELQKTEIATAAKPKGSKLWPLNWFRK